MLAHALDAIAHGGATEVIGVVYDDGEVADRARGCPGTEWWQRCAITQSGGVLRSTPARQRCVVVVHTCDDRALLPAGRPILAVQTTPFRGGGDVRRHGCPARSGRPWPRRSSPRPAADRQLLTPLIAEAENAVVQAVRRHAPREERSAKRAIFAAARAAGAAEPTTKVIYSAMRNWPGSALRSVRISRWRDSV